MILKINIFFKTQEIFHWSLTEVECRLTSAELKNRLQWWIAWVVGYFFIHWPLGAVWSAWEHSRALETALSSAPERISPGFLKAVWSAWERSRALWTGFWPFSNPFQVFQEARSQLARGPCLIQFHHRGASGPQIKELRDVQIGVSTGCQNHS